MLAVVISLADTGNDAGTFEVVVAGHSLGSVIGALFVRLLKQVRPELYTQTTGIFFAPAFSWLSRNEITAEMDREENYVVYSEGDMLSWGSLLSFARARKVELEVQCQAEVQVMRMVQGLKGHSLDQNIRSLKRTSQSTHLSQCSSDPDLLQSHWNELCGNEPQSACLSFVHPG